MVNTISLRKGYVPSKLLKVAYDYTDKIRAAYCMYTDGDRELAISIKKKIDERQPLSDHEIDALKKFL